jgi:hypothetical protein
MVASGTYDDLRETSSFARLLGNTDQHVEQDKGHIVPLQRLQSTTESISSTLSNEEELPSSRPYAEKMREGRVGWRVFTAYLRAGIGLISGFLLLFSFFSIQQTITIYSNWRLAKWSTDESDRHDTWRNCTNVINQKSSRISNMTDVQWNNQRNENFYNYCGLY